jgi:crotonobetainyl-CoA:carnitine CoA-transferase CaiB-like acyl-CoA transferase
MVGAGADNNAGKRWAFLDLRTPEGRDRFLELVAQADVLAHSYRPGSLDRLVDPQLRAAARPGLVEVTLDAYGWTGPWRSRRGFDTIVQYSTGVAEETTAWALADPDRRIPLNSLGHDVAADRPRHLPVEALDFVTGYLLGAAAIRGLNTRLRDGRGSLSRLSLARTAALVMDTRADPDEPALKPPLDVQYPEQPYASTRGPALRMPFAIDIDRNPLFWERPSERAGSSTPSWSRP